MGADFAFVDDVRTRAEMESIARGLAESKIVSLVGGTDAAAPTRAELFELGFSVVLYAVTTLFAA